jgi:biopolymer transport protein ExbD
MFDMKSFKDIALGIIALCVVILAGIAIYDKWSDYRRAKEDEVAVTQMEANKPLRFQVDIPTPSSSPSEPSNALFVSVDSEGALKVNDEPAGTINDMSQIRSKMSQIIKDRKDKVVIIRASSKLKYVEITKLIDEIKGAGASSVNLQMEPLAAN